MSSTIACQGLQISCVEPPLVLRTKFASPKSNLSQSFPWPQKPHNSPSRQQDEAQENPRNNEEEIAKNSNGDLGGWSFFQALSKTPQISRELPENNDKIYVHPLVKRSSSTLSKKSLEMCTESLGSETGSHISQSSDDFSIDSHSHIVRSKSREFGAKQGLSPSRSFPPPLTSISGFDSVKVRPIREGGRLVMKAVTVSSGNSLFQAERADGRLRLSLLTQKQSRMSWNDQEVVEEHAKEYNDEDYDQEANDDATDDDEVEESGIGVGEVARPSRCKEGGGRNKEMSPWGPVWVATS
ncbi:protein FANTASTIC FOUR 3 [Diospyros lotus]|uniref:protein FANTASTIC FOUR 3 n=1 Tax=Diospyros lotus TaxID=55363 RepID=UPI00225A09E1|nr:protein FANTASTIC FOUR 3 [Diospyros lotus]